MGGGGVRDTKNSLKPLGPIRSLTVGGRKILVKRQIFGGRQKKKCLLLYVIEYVSNIVKRVSECK